uniref:Uncharacterized protein n=1 Tax=Romanomermis culicivorax TaxID=13658 RepID=A0A915I603_ROMCU
MATSGIIETDSSFGQPQDRQDNTSFLSFRKTIITCVDWCGLQIYLIILRPYSVGCIPPSRTLLFLLSEFVKV